MRLGLVEWAAALVSGHDSQGHLYQGLLVPHEGTGLHVLPLPGSLARRTCLPENVFTPTHACWQHPPEGDGQPGQPSLQKEREDYPGHSGCLLSGPQHRAAQGGRVCFGLEAELCPEACQVTPKEC